MGDASSEKVKVQSVWLAIGVVISIVVLLVESFVIASLWRWFVVPIGFHPITWPTALGLNLLFNVMLTHTYVKRTHEESAYDAVYALVRALSAYAIAALVHVASL